MEGYVRSSANCPHIGSENGQKAEETRAHCEKTDGKRPRVGDQAFAADQANCPQAFAADQADCPQAFASDQADCPQAFASDESHRQETGQETGQASGSQSLAQETRDQAGEEQGCAKIDKISEKNERQTSTEIIYPRGNRREAIWPRGNRREANYPRDNRRENNYPRGDSREAGRAQSSEPEIRSQADCEARTCSQSTRARAGQGNG
ncbi:MAG: hypothetical protein ABIS68_09445 [Casimicrobiaceae bacterium]